MDILKPKSAGCRKRATGWEFGEIIKFKIVLFLIGYMFVMWSNSLPTHNDICEDN